MLADLILHRSVLEIAPESVQLLSAIEIKSPEYIEMAKPRDEEILSSWDATDEVIDDWENMHGEEQEVTSCGVEQIVQGTTPAKDEVCIFSRSQHYLILPTIINEDIQLAYHTFVDGFDGV